MSKRLQELERETAEMEVQLHKKRDEAEVKERVEGLGRAFRENFSLRLEQMRVSAQQHRQTVGSSHLVHDEHYLACIVKSARVGAEAMERTRREQRHA